MGKNALIIGIVVLVLVIGVVWWLGERKQASLPQSPPQVKSTSGTTGLRSSTAALGTAVCATVLTAKGAGVAAPACALVAPLATDVFATGLNEAGKALKSGFGLFS